MNKTITIETVVRKDIKTVWDLFTGPEHIEKWAHASDDWECTKAMNDLRVSGRFSSTMGAKDKSVSFDFTGTYTVVEEGKALAYTLDDSRTVVTSFTEEKDGVHIIQTFEMENENSEELQQGGWQAILDTFKKYTESVQ
mgnify:FL=1